MSKGCSRVEHLGLPDVDLYWLDIVLEHAGSTALDTPAFTPARATGIRDLPVMVWPIIQARCHLIGATLLATEYASFTNF